jgi:hypothetical protein
VVLSVLYIAFQRVLQLVPIQAATTAFIRALCLEDADDSSTVKAYLPTDEGFGCDLRRKVASSRSPRTDVPASSRPGMPPVHGGAHANSGYSSCLSGTLLPVSQGRTTPAVTRR